MSKSVDDESVTVRGTRQGGRRTLNTDASNGVGLYFVRIGWLVNLLVGLWKLRSAVSTADSDTSRAEKRQLNQHRAI